MSHALLLAAGRATRLGAIREQYAKACVPIGGTTPLRFLLESFATAGYENLWINTHYRAEQVREHARAVAPSGLRLHFLHEPSLLGTGGTLLHLWKEHGVLPHAVANAKMFTDYPFAQLRDAAEGTLVLHPASSLSTFGGLSYTAQGKVLGLHARDKNLVRGEQAAVFTGIYRPHASWLESLQAEKNQKPDALLCTVRHGLLRHLDSAQVQLHSGLWCEVSTPERVQQAEVRLRQRAASS